MPDLTGKERFAYVGDCVWCGRPSTSEFMAEGVGRMLPLHPLCAVNLVYKYNRWRRNALRPEDRERAIALWGPVPQLEPGQRMVIPNSNVNEAID